MSKADRLSAVSRGCQHALLGEPQSHGLVLSLIKHAPPPPPIKTACCLSSCEAIKGNLPLSDSLPGKHD